MEKYLSMAEIVMEKALGPADDQGKTYIFRPDDLIGGSSSGSMRVLSSRGSINLSLPFTRDGLYKVKILATASRAGNEFANMIVGLNGETIEEFSVDAEYPNQKTYLLDFSANVSPNNEISLTFPNDFYDPQNKSPKRRDRNLYIDKVEILEPAGVSYSVKKTRSYLFDEWKSNQIGDEVAKNSLQKCSLCKVSPDCNCEYAPLKGEENDISEVKSSEPHGHDVAASSIAAFGKFSALHGNQLNRLSAP